MQGFAFIEPFDEEGMKTSVKNLSTQITSLPLFILQAFFFYYQ